MNHDYRVQFRLSPFVISNAAGHLVMVQTALHFIQDEQNGQATRIATIRITSALNLYKKNKTTILVTDSALPKPMNFFQSCL